MCYYIVLEYVYDVIRCSVYFMIFVLKNFDILIVIKIVFVVFYKNFDKFWEILYVNF